MIHNFVVSIILINSIRASRLLQALPEHIGQYPIDICSLPSHTGPCEALIHRYYHDAQVGECKIFTYGGCAGNKNNFNTLSDCESTCINIVQPTNSPTDTVPNDFDWNGALQELKAKKSLWKSNGITKYLYHLQQMCFCQQCDVAGKYIEITGGVATQVQFDYFGIKAGCTNDDIHQTYLSLDDYFTMAIQFVKRGMKAQCINDPINNQYADVICGGTVNIEYDSVLNYPTKIALNLGPNIADGNTIYNINCLSVLHVQGQQAEITYYNNECYVCSKVFGETCTSHEECCDSYCVDLHLTKGKTCWLE